ncbi:MAG: sulfate ABC transporter permease subunit CysT [Verrucomicrobiae bacterium]|nr:sulfate ABC transporter permease subunit CysT [Verrucomicrobiae bacterium]
MNPTGHISTETLPSMLPRKSRRLIPGFGLSMGITLFYLSFIVLIPMAALFGKTIPMGGEAFFREAFSPRVMASYRLSFSAALAGALINVVFGTLTAWVLVRYNFPGKKIIDSLVDLPFALPTAVAGITLTTLYAENGWLGQWLIPFGIKVSFTELGIILALAFIGLPFVVRTIQPILEELEPEIEEAAASLGASRWQTIQRVILPEIWPAILAGFTMAFARGLGEFGSVVFIAGNMPYKTEITPLLIIIKLEEYNYTGATAIGCVMMFVSFSLLLLINLLQRFMARRLNH